MRWLRFSHLLHTSILPCDSQAWPGAVYHPVQVKCPSPPTRYIRLHCGKGGSNDTRSLTHTLTHTTRPGKHRVQTGHWYKGTCFIRDSESLIIDFLYIFDSSGLGDQYSLTYTRQCRAQHIPKPDLGRSTVSGRRAARHAGSVYGPQP